MPMPGVAVKWWLALVMFLSATASVAAEDAGCDPLTFYDAVLPNIATDAEQRGMNEIILIRYVPGDTSREREYQITIFDDRDGRITARRRDPLGSSLREQLRAEETRHPDANCETIMKTLRTEDHRISDSPTLRRLLREFAKVRIPARLPASIYLDSPRYEIVDWTPMNQASLTIYRGSDTANYDILRWIKTVNAGLRHSTMDGKR